MTEKWVLCRICLKESNKEMGKIFHTDADDSKDLAEQIELCGGIRMCRADDMPNKICSKCTLCLKVAYKFRITCQRSDKQLRKLMALTAEIDDRAGQLDEVEESQSKDSAIMVKQEEQQEMVGFIVADELDEVDEYEAEIQNDQAEYLQDDSSSLHTDDDYVTYVGTNAQYVDNAEIENGTSVVEETYVDEESVMAENMEMCNDKEEQYDMRIKDANNEYKIITHFNANSQRRRSKRDSLSPNRQLVKRTGDGESPFVCPYCCNMYGEKTKLNLHLKIHTKEKPHECEICQKRFAQSPQLARHMNSHTGNKPYKCSYCPACFADPSTLCKHERIHNNIRPYKCETCGKAFAYTNVLKVHIMTHTGEKPHTCTYCGKGFSQLHHMRAHQRIHREYKDS